LSSLLSRFAENTFWLGRYLERAENLARVLHVNATYGRDDPSGPEWGRVLRLYADEELFAKSNEESSAAAVLNFYMIDRNNPGSIASMIVAARENARSIRHLISTEMWTHLNVFSNQVRALTARDLRLSNLSTVATQVVTGCQTFEGVAEGTFVRQSPWCFYQIGKYLERGDQTTRVLDIGYDRLLLDKHDAIATVQWNLLLRSVSAYHAYRGKYPGDSRNNEIATFLICDDEFPRAVSLCVNRLVERLRDIERRHGGGRAAGIEKTLGALDAFLDKGPGRRLTPVRLHAFLDRVQIALGNVSDAVGECYFK
jgi:uncharacterized alpha-E superfamily protein